MFDKNKSQRAQHMQHQSILRGTTEQKRLVKDRGDVRMRALKGLRAVNKSACKKEGKAGRYLSFDRGF